MYQLGEIQTSFENATFRDGEKRHSIEGRTSELPDDSGKRAFRVQLPDDSGGRAFCAQLPNDSGETTDKMKASSGQDVSDSPEKNEPIQNKKDGLEREHVVEQELREQYPEKEGYEILSEAYLRDSEGNIACDSVTGERRRVDFVVIKDGKAVDSVEVTSMTAPKDAQMDKENRIRDGGGNYVKDKEGNLIEIPDSVRTRIARRA